VCGSRQCILVTESDRPDNAGRTHSLVENGPQQKRGRRLAVCSGDTAEDHPARGVPVKPFRRQCHRFRAVPDDDGRQHAVHLPLHKQRRGSAPHGLIDIIVTVGRRPTAAKRKPFSTSLESVEIPRISISLKFKKLDTSTPSRSSESLNRSLPRKIGPLGDLNTCHRSAPQCNNTARLDLLPGSRRLGGHTAETLDPTPQSPSQENTPCKPCRHRSHIRYLYIALAMRLSLPLKLRNPGQGSESKPPLHPLRTGA